MPATKSKRELAKANTVPEIKALRDKIAALCDYARASGEGRDKQNEVGEAKVEAECKAGELLRKIERLPGGRPSNNTRQSDGGFYAAIDEAGLSEPMARRWQIMSYCPADERQAYYAKTKRAPGLGPGARNSLQER